MNVALRSPRCLALCAGVGGLDLGLSLAVPGAPMNQDNAVAEALERLAALATPGPWCGYSEPEVGLPYGLFAGIIGQSAFMQMEPLCAYDIDLIVALRNNLPTIIAALKAQRVDEGGVS